MRQLEISEAYEQLMESFQTFQNLVRSNDRQLYEQWKAGGFMVSEDFVSMYPNATEVFEKLESEFIDEETDDEDDESETHYEMSAEEQRRDEKHGLYPQHDDPSN